MDHNCGSISPMPRSRLLPMPDATFSYFPIAAATHCDSRVFLSGRSALQAGWTVAGLGDPAAQTHAALDSIAAALQAAGGSLRDITKLTTTLVDRAHRKPVYEAIGSGLRDVSRSARACWSPDCRCPN